MTSFPFKKSQTRTFIKFCIVGIICTMIDVIVFYVLDERVGYRAAIVSGFVLSIGVNYLLNTLWSFRQKFSLKTVIGVLFAHLFNIFVVRMGLMWVFIDLFILPDRIAYIPTLVISTITNYMIIRMVYFREYSWKKYFQVCEKR